MRNYKLPTLPESVTVTVPLRAHPSVLGRFAAKAAIKSVAGLTKLTLFGADIDIKHQVDIELAASKPPMATYNTDDK
jgi:hypothetical protein